MHDARCLQSSQFISNLQAYHGQYQVLGDGAFQHHSHLHVIPPYGAEELVQDHKANRAVVEMSFSQINDANSSSDMWRHHLRLMPYASKLRVCLHNWKLRFQFYKHNGALQHLSSNIFS